MQITPERCEFKEFALGDKVFFGNCFWSKIADRQAEIIQSINPEEVGIIKTFTGNCLVNIVID